MLTMPFYLLVMFPMTNYKGVRRRRKRRMVLVMMMMTMMMIIFKKESKVIAGPWLLYQFTHQWNVTITRKATLRAPMDGWENDVVVMGQKPIPL